MTVTPELACVVLAVGAPPELDGALSSLRDQDESIEILVVNSGGGDLAARLAGAGLPATCGVTSRARLLPGAARNAGVAATRAPWVSFLAADCLAESGWAAARLCAHRAGALAVASAITNPYRGDVPAWTSYIALFHRRMPGAPAASALRYGASYDRALLGGLGGFRSDLRTGEDTELNQRLPRGVEIAWEPRVRTAHRHPRSLAGLLDDQRRRGRRSAAAWRKLSGLSPLTVAANALTRVPVAAREARRNCDPGDRRWIAAACSLLPLAALAYAAGALSPDLGGDAR